ncbi:DUF7386 family protein [Halosolutus gelatinilyticus]|uniref:DUF7386 family protein n=1 Tax=Halosolutus gelatinilyticus TaxID=2931975 RepID=UPI001FF6D8CD|nr:hypothetical protein [Halosolutus gelatinilyticus]
MARRTSLKLTDERERQLECASELIAADPHDNSSMSTAIDAALPHLLESEQNIQDAPGEYGPETIQDLCNTSVIGLRY